MVRGPTGRWIGICVLLVSLVSLSGCLTIPISVDSSVDEDGTISSYEMRLNISTNAYSYIQRGARSEGYSSTEEYIMNKSMSEINRTRVGNIEYSESVNGRNVTVTIRLEDYTPANNSLISVTKRNGRVIYTDRTFEASDAASGPDSLTVPVRYTLTMPGEILNSSADRVEGDTATWEMTDAEASQTRIHAKSDVSDEKRQLPVTDDSTLVAVSLVVGISLILVYWLR
ncbi:hypothetical protein [Halocatena marina]|uniref:hypothetical protein n=1 Tax=Halocatena marina TaxID=2934937 RepID=UPI00200E72C6|nr:hypothetical protein [Halocatena marina]